MPACCCRTPTRLRRRASTSSVVAALMHTLIASTAFDRAICVAPQPILLRPVQVAAPSGDRPVLVYLPGSDGTGASVTPQLPGLHEAGFDVRRAPAGKNRVQKQGFRVRARVSILLRRLLCFDVRGTAASQE